MAAYHRPVTLDDALHLLARGKKRVAAGCTDLFPMTQAKALPGDIIDITAISALRGVSHDADGWRIGAATTWADIMGAEMPPAFDGLKLAAAELGSVQIQNVATIAGNLCTASPAGDGIPCLLTLDASVELRSERASRILPLADFLTGARQTALRPDELIAAVLVPDHAVCGAGHFLKLGARRYLVISIAMAALRLQTDAGHIVNAAVSVGACSAVAKRLHDLEATLKGKPINGCAGLVSEDLVAAQLSPIDDIRGDREYRIAAAVQLIRRSLTALTSIREAAA